MLDWAPASIRVARITRPKCACRACGTLHQAPAPERVLAGGLVTHGLIVAFPDHATRAVQLERLAEWLLDRASVR